MIKDYFVELGLNVVKDSAISIKEKYDLRVRLESFIERKMKENYNCSMEEELDFGGLVEYINGNFTADVHKRLFGNLSERRAANTTIMRNAVIYSQSKTHLSARRAKKLISEALRILRDFYRKKVNKDLWLVAAEVEDTIIDELSNRLIEQTEKITERIDASDNSHLVLSIDKNLQNLRDMDYATAEENLNLFINAMSAEHKLFPFYGYSLSTTNGKMEYKSVPLSKEAEKMYPPKMKCVGTIKVGDGYVNEISPNTINYANRHQLPIVIDVKEAKKYLGNVIDPVQHEAEQIVGETIVISPAPFPEAFPCSFLFDGVTQFEYITLRTQEILDDGVVIVSNNEQTECPYKITIRMNPSDHTCDFSFQKKENISNTHYLKYAQIMQKALNGTTMSVKLLKTGEIFIEGVFKNFSYNGGFESVEEEVDFLERIVLLEEYFGENINVPNDIYQDDWEALCYISDLISGRTCNGEWQKQVFTFEFSEDLKNAIQNTDDKNFNLSYAGTVTVPLWDEKYEIPIVRTLENGHFEDLGKIKEKVSVLEKGDILKVVFVSDTGPSNRNDVINNK